jgi:hypothetical protein
MPDVELQFDRLVTEPGSSPPGAVSVTCSVCLASVETEYYDINGNTACGACRVAVESGAHVPSGIGPFVLGAVFGLGAGIAGAIIYYAVIALTNLEIGIVAILIGYMVGYAVRKGAGGHGGLRFQVLAVVLTYASVALAYTPLVIKGIAESERNARTNATEPAAVPTTAGEPAAAAEAAHVPGGTLVALAMVTAFVLALPVLVVIGSLPSGLISAFIIFIGMRQAWVMTRAPDLQVFGPYRVGDGPPAAAE